MTKALRDLGNLVECSKPFKFRRYDVGALPDPGENTDCLIIVNDRKDGQPRARLALSNGASWDYIAYLHELTTPQQYVDVAPMVRQAVRDTLPALLSAQPPQALISAPAQSSMDDARLAGIDADRREMAAAMLEMAQTINDLAHRVHHLENNALDVRSQITTQERAA